MSAVETATREVEQAEGRLTALRNRIAELEAKEQELLAAAAQAVAEGTEPDGARSGRIQIRLEIEDSRAAIPHVEAAVEAARERLADAKREAARAELVALGKQAAKADTKIEKAMESLVAALEERLALSSPANSAAGRAGIRFDYGSQRALRGWVASRLYPFWPGEVGTHQDRVAYGKRTLSSADPLARVTAESLRRPTDDDTQ